MIEDKALDLHAEVTSYDKAVRPLHWAYFVPLFQWAKTAGLNASKIGMEADVLPGTVYHGVMAINKGVNRKVQESVSVKLVAFAKRKGVQL